MNQLLDWLDDRTGIRELARHALMEPVPGGSRWRYVTGSMLVLAFVTQVITGVFLWMCYSPGTQNAWESVYYIQHEMTGGWFLRGLHHTMAQAMVVLLPIHLLQVVVDKAYVAPREFNYWLGLVLMLIVLALGLTGYLLPWDQKGYWATSVATNLMGLAPGGPYLQKLVVGGSNYGQHTLTRFFALHAGLLPGLLVVVLVGHLALFRRHGLTAYRPDPARDQFFWPHQVMKDSVAFVLLLAVICAVVGMEGGAELGAPADPTENYDAARPEWYFLFLFQMLKWFHESEFLGAIVVPGLIVGYLFLLPLIGKIQAGHLLNVVVLVGLTGCAGYLTYEAIYQDRYAAWHDDPPGEDATPAERQLYADSEAYLRAVDEGEKEAHRVHQLARHFGIPRDGMLTQVRHDPEIMGPRIFREKCAGCHSYLDPDGVGIASSASEPGSGAPNLYGFGSREWLTGLLDPARIATSQYFGDTAQGRQGEDDTYPSGGMVEFVHDALTDLGAEQQEELAALVSAVSAEAELARQEAVDQTAVENGTIERGLRAFRDEFGCADCHKLGDSGELGAAPDLTGWGSYEWLVGMIRQPEHERFYEVSNDRMPAFGASDNDAENLLTAEQIDLLARWIREELRVLDETPPASVH